MKDFEKENQRLRRAVSDLTLDNQILNEVAQGKFQALLFNAMRSITWS